MYISSLFKNDFKSLIISIQEFPSSFSHKVSNNILSSNSNSIFLFLKKLIAVFLAGLTALKIYTLTLKPIKNLEHYKPNVVTQIELKCLK